MKAFIVFTDAYMKYVVISESEIELRKVFKTSGVEIREIEPISCDDVVIA
jgi:hypothetical protein